MTTKSKSRAKKSDDLTKTKEKKDVELKDEELSRVTGGAFDTYMQFQGHKGE